MSVNLALTVLSDVGPRGGDLTKEHEHRERRVAQLNADVDPATGMPKLHRFSKVETAVPGLKNEQPWHRMAAYMLQAGRTNSEIALAANVGVPAVVLLRTQRWFQDLLATISNESGQDIQGALLSHVHTAINNIADIANDPELPARVRLAANVSLLEHANGKPTQKIVSTSTVSHLDAKEEFAQIEDELRILRARNTNPPQ